MTLFASGDSVTQAKLEAPCHRALRLNTGIFQPRAPLSFKMMEQVFAAADQFDPDSLHLWIFWHFPFPPLPCARRDDAHGRLVA